MDNQPAEQFWRPPVPDDYGLFRLPAQLADTVAAWLERAWWAGVSTGLGLGLALGLILGMFIGIYVARRGNP
jgi:hypothetical protein